MLFGWNSSHCPLQIGDLVAYFGTIVFFTTQLHPSLWLWCCSWDCSWYWLEEDSPFSFMALRSKQNPALKDPPIPNAMCHVTPSNATVTYSTNPVVFSNSSCTTNKPGYSSIKRRTMGPRKSDNQVIHGWIEAMKDSSPRRVRIDPFSKSDADTGEMHYKAWLAKHPSALERLENLLENVNPKNIFVFLDYDGTLSAIVEDPECAFMSNEMREMVREIATLFPTAIITGRSREKVFEFVQLPELYYAGSHGMDIRGPAKGCSAGLKAIGKKALDEKGNEVVLFQPASEFTSVMNEVFKLLEEKAKKVVGAKVEHNKFCVTMHFRCVKEEYWPELAKEVQHVLGLYPNLYVTQGRKVLEVRPRVSWNKGKALDYLLHNLGFGGRSETFPIYIGDDQTDEDAFKVVTKKKHGLAILVSSVAKETHAVCSLRDPLEVLEFLRNLIKWKRKHLSSSQ